MKKASQCLQCLALDYKSVADRKEVETEITPMFSAVVLYDFESDDFEGSITISAGEHVLLFGNSTDVICTQEGNIEQHLSVTEGWIKCQRSDGAIGYVPFEFVKIKNNGPILSEFSLSQRKVDHFDTRDINELSKAPGSPGKLEQFIYPSAWSYTTMFLNNSIQSSISVLKTWLEGNGVNLKKIEMFMKSASEDGSACEEYHDFDKSESYILPYGNEVSQSRKGYSDCVSMSSSSVFGTFIIQDGPSWKSNSPIFEIGISNPQRLKVVDDKKVTEEFISFQVTSFVYFALTSSLSQCVQRPEVIHLPSPSPEDIAILNGFIQTSKEYFQQ